MKSSHMTSRKGSAALQLVMLLAFKDFGCSGLPLSTAAAKRSQDFWEQQAAIRATLITKDTFAAGNRGNRQLSSLPAPFTISTSVNVHGNSGKGQEGSRRGRSYPDKDGTTVIVEGVRVPDDESDRVTHRNGRFINNVFVPNGAEIQLPAERVVSSSRRQPKMFARQWQVVSQPAANRRRQNAARAGLPYQAYDFDNHYAGRTPDLPDSLAVESRQAEVVVNLDGSEVSGEPRDYSYHAGSTDAGRPVYYVVEEDDSLHSDRSPYDFEPADTHTSFTSAVADYTQAGAAADYAAQGGPLGGGTPVDGNDFIIKEHTYTMCPGCPTFSIPIPIPKSTLNQGNQKPQQQQQLAGPGGYPYHSTNGGKLEYQHASNKTFLQKIGDRIVTAVKSYPANAKFLYNKVKENLFGGGGDEDEFTGDDNSLDGSEDIKDRVSSDDGDVDEEEEKEDGGGFDYFPIMASGAAALAVGAFVVAENAALLANVLPSVLGSADKVDASVIGGRSLGVEAGAANESSEQIIKSIEKAQEKYDDDDVTAANDVIGNDR